MSSLPPGVLVNVIAGNSSPQSASPTATWFVVGDAYGPGDIAVPINSINDFITYFGQIISGQLAGRYIVTADGVTTSSNLLYDSLDVFFREGGINAWVVNRTPSGGGVSAATASGTGATILTAISNGEWSNSSDAGANGLIVTVTAPTTSTSLFATIAYNGVTLATSPGLAGDADLQAWINSLPGYLAMCTAASQAHATVLPTASSGSSVALYFTAGTDYALTDTDTTNALAAFGAQYGPGQVSFPGHTTSAGYAALTEHAALYNRVALLDAVNTATVATLTSAVTTLQGTGGVDPSRAAFFAPWLIAPGLISTNPSGSSAAVFSRTVPPTALAAAKCAVVDQFGDANTAAAGRNGQTSYVTGLSQPPFVASDLATLNNGQVNIIKLVPSLAAIEVYGFRSASFDPTWLYLNNVRFRMQIINDFDAILEQYVFEEIDAKQQLFGKVNGALVSQCQLYYGRGSLYGVSAGAAFQVNTGPQVNTPATIAAHQINAQVALIMAPEAEFVFVTVSKYGASSPLPTA